MLWFKNLKTVTKLMLTFGFMAVLMGLLGYQALNRMAAMNGMLESLYHRDMLGLSAMKEANTSLAYVGRMVRSGLLATDKADARRYNDDVEKYLAAMSTELTKVEKTLATEEGRAEMARLRETYAAYTPQVRQIMRLAMEGNGSGARDALTAVLPVASRLDQGMSKVASLKEQLGEKAYEESGATYAAARNFVISMLAGAMILAMVMGYFIARLIATPLQEMVVVAGNLAEGRLDQEVSYKSRDEVGRLADAFRTMIIGFSKPVKEAAEVLARVAKRDLTARMQGEAKGDFTIIKTSLNQAVENLGRAMDEVRVSADQVAATSQQLSAASGDISTGAQEQASSLEETSATLEEITSTVKQNAENARQASQLAAGARDSAEKGGSVVGAAVAAMGEINTSSKRIADIITTIDEIAFQTNLLALNAAVEAARAGEQGRGFAVVASEVRNLAQRSATAAKEIKALIQDSVKKVENGSDLVNNSGQTLHEIVASVKRVTDIVAEIAAASQEQATGVEQVAKAMSQMDQVTQANSSQTEEMSSTAEELSATAEKLRDLVEQFKLDDATGYHRPVTHVVKHSKPVVNKRRSQPQRPPTPLAEPALARLARHTAEQDTDSFEEF